MPWEEAIIERDEAISAVEYYGRMAERKRCNTILMSYISEFVEQHGIRKKKSMEFLDALREIQRRMYDDGVDNPARLLRWVPSVLENAALVETRRRLEWIRDMRWQNDGDLDDACTYAEQALAHILPSGSPEPTTVNET